MNSLSFKTDFGWISAFEVKNRIVRIKFGKCNNRNVSKNLRKLRSNISSFFNKRKRSIEANFYINGSINQKKIWKELKKIRLGKTKSYGEIAKKFKLSPRYVGKICGQNKIVLGIPCHRVIRSDGSLGGFSGIGGVNLKRKLLNLEKNWK
tara:strand:+ start:111 stop:560 length:450 start_codon:yes stop_codon:yes gene_type:complete